MIEEEVEVVKIDAKGKYIVVVTNKLIKKKFFDISRRTYKQLGVTRNFGIKLGEIIGEIKDNALNADGKKLAMLFD